MLWLPALMILIAEVELRARGGMNMPNNNSFRQRLHGSHSLGPLAFQHFLAFL